MSLNVTLAALVTSFLTRMSEQVVGRAIDLGDAALDSLGVFLRRLWDKDRETAQRIERVRNDPDQARQDPATYGIESLADRLCALARQDPEWAQSLADLGEMLRKHVERNTGNTLVLTGITAQGSIRVGDVTVSSAGPVTSVAGDLQAGGDIDIKNISVNTER